MAHQYMPKIFLGPHKNPPALPPIYLMYGPLVPDEFEIKREMLSDYQLNIADSYNILKLFKN